MPIIPAFLAPRPSRRPLRARLAGVAQRLTGVVAEFRAPSVAVTATVADPTTNLGATEAVSADLPDLAEIEAAAGAYERAADAARAAERSKRKANKVLSLVPAGVWGSWRIERVQSGRSTVDLDAVRAHYKALGLEVPMKSSAPSLKVSRVAAGTPDAQLAEAEFAALAGVR